MTSIQRNPNPTASKSSSSSSSSSTSTTSAKAPPPPTEDAEAMPSTTTSATTSTAKPSSMSEAQQKQIEGDIRRSFAPKVLDESQGAAIVDLLAKLPPAAFRAEVDRLAASGNLDKLVGALDDNGRANLMFLLERKGVIDAVPTSSTPTSPTAPPPPAAPHLVRVNADAPPPLKRLAEEQNIAAARAYRAAYDDYSAAYAAAVDGSSTVRSLRALGPQAPSALPETMPGTPSAEAQRTFREAGAVVDHSMQRVADRYRALTGREVAGTSFGVAAEAGFTVGEGTSKLGVGVGVEGTTGPAGNEFEAVGTASLGGIGADSDGVIRGELDAGELATDALGGAAEDLGVEFGVSDKEGIEVGGSYGPVRGGAGFNGDAMEFSVGVGREFKLGDAEVDVHVDAKVGLQGVTAEDRASFVSTSQVGFFTTPPELKQGKAWEKLPAETRETYERLGWSKAEWDAGRDLQLRR